MFYPPSMHNTFMFIMSIKLVTRFHFHLHFHLMCDCSMAQNYYPDGLTYTHTDTLTTKKVEIVKISPFVKRNMEFVSVNDNGITIKSVKFGLMLPPPNSPISSYLLFLFVGSVVVVVVDVQSLFFPFPSPIILFWVCVLFFCILYFFSFFTHSGCSKRIFPTETMA